jgi:hypothetical protein
MSFIKLRSSWTGAHVSQRIYVGWDKDHLQLAGTLMLDVGQYQEFGAALLLGAERFNRSGHPLTVISEADLSMVEMLRRGEI